MNLEEKEKRLYLLNVVGKGVAALIEDLDELNDKFLKESFGEFTNTIGLEHPDKNAHIIWADFLYEKIKEFKYI